MRPGCGNPSRATWPTTTATAGRRGNESMSGVTVNLLKIAKAGDVSKDKKDTTFTAVATVETDRSGLYEFNDLKELGKYYVEVAAGDDHMGVKDLDDGPNNKSGEVNPMEYPELDEGDFALPEWDYANNELVHMTSARQRLPTARRRPLSRRRSRTSPWSSRTTPSRVA